MKPLSVLFLSHPTKTVLWSIVINLFPRHLSTSLHFYISIFYSESTIGQLNPHLAGMFTERSSTKFMLIFFFQSQSTTETRDLKCGTFIFQPILIVLFFMLLIKLSLCCISYHFRDIRGSRWGKLPIFGISFCLQFWNV